MKKAGNLCRRGIAYVRRHGIKKLYYKVRERQQQNRREAGYPEWLAGQQRAALEANSMEQGRREGPCISILVPAYETPGEFLRQMIDSVLAQTYPNWELCIADGSESTVVWDTLAPYMQKDSRIRCEHLVKNLGIAENTNAALAMAAGEYVGLLDHDDVLFPQALEEVAAAMARQPDAEAFYTDEDKVSFDLKTHFRPHFKPDYNEELLRSNNYICHFFVVKTKIAREAGGFCGEYDGAQDYDFILRCTEIAKKVCHIPKVLYSWRSHAASTAENPESKLYAYEAGKRAVAAHLRRVKEPGEVLDTENYGFYRVRYKADEKQGSWPRQEVLNKSLKNINGQTGVKVVYYDKACNKIVTFPDSEVGADYVLFTCVRNGVLQGDSLSELRACCERRQIGIACAAVYDCRGRLTHSLSMAGGDSPFVPSVQGLKKGCLGYMHRVGLQQEVNQLTDCFLMKEKLLAELFADKQETFSLDELLQRANKKGYKAVYDPAAVLYERA